MKVLLAILFLALVPAMGWAQVSITNHSGDVDNAGEISIYGSGFGDNGPTVTLFDDFENGTSGQSLTLGSAGNLNVGAPFGSWANFGNGPTYCLYSNAYSHSGGQSYRVIPDWNTNRAWTMMANEQRDYFISFSVRVPYGCPTGGSNVKIVWVTAPNETTCDDTTVPTITPPNNDCGLTRGEVGGNDKEGRTSPGYYTVWYNQSWNSSSWYSSQFYMHGNTGSGTADGNFVLKYKFSDGATYNTHTRENFIWYSPGQHANNDCYSYGTVKRVMFPGNCQSPGKELFFDDIYVAEGPYARARVELGDNGSYANCTTLAICPTTSWSDNSIVANVRTSNLSEGSAYLYVTHADGSVNSTGYPVTIGIVVPPLDAPEKVLNVQGDNTQGDFRADITWDANDPTGLAGYWVGRSDSPGGPYADAHGTIIPDDEEAFTNSGLESGKSYYYIVQAQNDDGLRSEYSDYVEVIPTGTVISGNITTPDSLRLSPMLELDLPIYGSWFNRLYDYPDAEDALTSAYYDSLAQVDVSILPVVSIADDRYAGLVDSVRVYNPDWIAIWHAKTTSVRGSSAGSGEGTFYQDIYDLINAGSTADGSYSKGLRLWAGANPDADWWARDINGDKVDIGTELNPDYVFQFGAEGLTDALAKVYLKHVKAQNNVRDFTGVLMDNQEPVFQSWYFNAAVRALMDIDGDGTADFTTAADSIAPTALLRQHLLELPGAFRRASNLDKYLITANGTAAHDSNYAWQYDGCTFEQHEVKNYYPRTNAGTDDIFRLWSRQSGFYSNAKVNPPLMMFLSYRDSCMLTNEALATIANGVAMFSYAEEDGSGFLDAGIGPLLDLTRPTDDNHLELGTRVPGSVTFSDWGTETIYVRNTWTAMTVSNATPILTSSLIVAVNTTANINDGTGEDPASQVYFEDVGGMTQLNDNAYTVDTVIDATNFSIAIDASAFDTYTSGGSVSEVTSSYDTDVGRVSAQFLNGSDVSTVTVDGFNRHHYPWPYLIVTEGDTISYGSVGIWKDE